MRPRVLRWDAARLPLCAARTFVSRPPALPTSLASILRLHALLPPSSLPSSCRPAYPAPLVALAFPSFCLRAPRAASTSPALPPLFTLLSTSYHAPCVLRNALPFSPSPLRARAGPHPPISPLRPCCALQQRSLPLPRCPVPLTPCDASSRDARSLLTASFLRSPSTTSTSPEPEPSSPAFLPFRPPHPAPHRNGFALFVEPPSATVSVPRLCLRFHPLLFSLSMSSFLLSPSPSPSPPFPLLPSLVLTSLALFSNARRTRMDPTRTQRGDGRERASG
ncbi:hypothetical protein C8R45DRAFT_1023565 [Mycena sanguinolenta]|nr:hypothetical protein C8R45DRAFT_1023565 [Mycena sanguinolenta]